MLRVKCRALLHEFVCDIVIFLFKTGESLLDATIRPYVIAAVCSDLYGGADVTSDISRTDGAGGLSVDNGTAFGDKGGVCWHLNDLPDIEAKVQSKAAGILVAHRVLVNVPAVILGLFCGAWSDTKGRKFPMMAPSAGSCLGVTLYLASTQVRDYKVFLLLAGAAIQGMFGKSPVISMAVNSHVADTSDTDQRTRRLGRLLASSFLGMFLGSLLAGVLQDLSSLLTTLLVVSICHALSVLTVLLGVPETRSPEVRDGAAGQAILRAEDEMAEEEQQKDPGLFSWAGCRESLMTVCRKREGNKRIVVIVSLLLITLNSCLKVGDQDVTVLFVQRPPLSWPQSWYGYLTAVDYATMGFSLLLLLPLLADMLRMSDVAIVTVGVAFKLVRSVWAGFCTETWMVFLSVVAGSLGGLITPALRSVLSKIVKEGEVGKMFSILASLETLSKLLGSSVFTGVYAATVDVISAAAYLLEAAVYLIVLGMTVWLAQMMREDGAHDLLLTFSRPYYAFHKANGKSDNSQSAGTVPVIQMEDTSRPQPHRESRLQSLGASTP